MMTTAPVGSMSRRLSEFAADVGAEGPVAVEGGRTRWELGGQLDSAARLVRAPSGIVAYAPEEMTVTVLAGTRTADLSEELTARGQRSSVAERGGTVGGAVVVGENHTEVMGRGALRASVLQVRYVSSEGRVITGGGPTVKNVTGFDLPRLITGSLGTLGMLGEVVLRTNPTPSTRRWMRSVEADPFAVRDALFKPGAVLWANATATTWVLVEGHASDVADQVRLLGTLGRFEDCEGPPPLPPHRWSLSHSALRSLDATMTGGFVASIGVGTVFAERPQPQRVVDAAARDVASRMKANFDPTGRLNPGRDPLRTA